MEEYLNMVKKLLTSEDSAIKGGRNGLTISNFGHQMTFNLNKGFPLLTTKKLHTKSIIHELLWFLKGDSNIKYLQDNKVRIWNEWADEDGELGRVYGVQWRDWTNQYKEKTDQIKELVRTLKEDPDSRRMIVTAWNPGELKYMNLPPCHMMFQLYTNKKKDNDQRRISLQLYQRSADIFLGVPFNIASYATLLKMFSIITGYEPSKFVHDLGDFHSYLGHNPKRTDYYFKNIDNILEDIKKTSNREEYKSIAEKIMRDSNVEDLSDHLPQLLIQLSREPKQLPELKINPKKNLEDFVFEDFKIINYFPHPTISGKVSA